MTAKKQQFSTIPDALTALRQGKMVIVSDDESRENEGDLICCADTITAQQINFMAREARGLICLTLPKEHAERLDFTPMVSRNTDAKRTNFTVSIDASPQFGITTGISASDRAQTIAQVMNDTAKASDFTRPGHIFPLIAEHGGVLKRAGHTEAGIDLSRLAEHKPGGVICEIMNEDGSMARRDDLFVFAKKHDIPFITIADLIRYRLKNERFVEREVISKLPTKFGEFQLVGYRNTLDNIEHVAVIKGDINQMGENTPHIRMHSECLTGDILGSLRCDCGQQLEGAMAHISEQDFGVIVYLRSHEGRGMGLLNKLYAYNLQDEGADTIEANEKLGFASDLRDYGVGAQILNDLGVKNFKLITNNPKKIVALNGYGLNVVDTIGLPVLCNDHNKRYLETKRVRMGHNVTYLK